jgi:rhomboid protease GluP
MVRVRMPDYKPTMTFTLVGITVVVFILQMATKQLMGADLPAYYGMKANDFIQAGQLWRFITPVFLHGSILHIGFNMYALYIIGPQLESLYGHWKYLVLYLIGGFGGVVLSFMMTSNASLGSSTAIFGLLGAEAVFIYQNRKMFGARADRNLRNIIFVAVINLIIGLSPGIDNWGHLGGLSAGLLVSWFGGPLLKITGELPDLRAVDDRSPFDFEMAASLTFLLFAALAGVVWYLRS